jgi:hypothetical protein
LGIREGREQAATSGSRRPHVSAFDDELRIQQSTRTTGKPELELASLDELLWFRAGWLARAT